MGATGERVLLIEQESDLRQLNELILREAGYTVVTVPPTDDPVEAAARLHPSVIVLRIRAGEPRDWALLDRLEGDARTAATPVVVIATAAREMVEAEAAPSVRQAVVMPYDIDALRRAVEEALGHPPPAALLPPSHRPPPGVLAAAGALLSRCSREILLRAIRRLQEIEPFRSRFAELSPGLIDNLPLILGAIAAALQRGLEPAEMAGAPPIRSAIQEHVRIRERQGLRPETVLEEYRVLEDQIQAFLGEESAGGALDPSGAFAAARAVQEYMAAVGQAAVSEFFQRPAARPAAPGR